MPPFSFSGGRPRVPATFFLLAHKRKSPKKKGAPVRRHYLVHSCGVPALLDQVGRLRNSRTHSDTAPDIRRESYRGEACVPVTRPVLADDPLPGLRLLGGEQGPQEK